MDNFQELGEVQEALRFYEIEEAKKDMIKFAEYVMVDEKGKSFKIGKMHAEWYNLLSDFMEPFINGEYMEEGFDDNTEMTKMLLMAPREHGKTTTMVCFILFLLGKNPRLRIKYVCAGDDMAVTIVGQVKKNIEMNDRLHDVFPFLRPDPNGSWSEHKVDVMKTGESGEWIDAALGIKDANLEASGVTSPGTGGRADLIIFDDIVSSKFALQEPKRLEAVERIFYSDWLNIGGKRTMVIGTPWLEDDLHAKILNSEDWIKWKKPVMTNNVPLWPERWSVEKILKKKKEIGDDVFALQFMLEGVRVQQHWWTEEIINKIKNPSISFGETINPSVIRVLGFDPAASMRNDGSFSCLTALAEDENGQRTILEIKRMRDTPQNVAEALIEMHLTHRFDKVIVENNATQQWVIGMVEVLAEHKYNSLDINVQGFFTGKSKWNPEIGLPRLVADMDIDGKWVLPFEGEHDDPLHECPACELIKELLGYPNKTRTTDMVMSLWLASNGLSSGSGSFSSLGNYVAKNNVGLTYTMGE